MKNMRILRRKQRGVTLTETLLVLGLAAVLATAAYRAYTTASNDAKNSEQNNGAIALVGKIKQVFGTDGDYDGLDAELLGKSGILPTQFRFNKGETPSVVRDVFGNEIIVFGSESGSFTLGFTLLSKEGCSTLASTLASVAYRINVGAGATGQDGTIDPNGTTNGLVYKDPETSKLNITNLVEGCSSDDAVERIVVVEIR